MTLTDAIEDEAVTRGGRAKDRSGPERRCLVTGETGAVDQLIRFVLSPEGVAVPDIAGKLPGRGAWLTADRDLVARAVKKNLFSRAFRQPVSVPDDLCKLLEALLATRLIDMIGLARKAGQAVTGAEKVRARITDGQTALLLQAHDGAPDGKAKVSALAKAAGKGQIERIEVLSSAELGLAFGREFAIHAALDAGGFAARVSAEAKRLSGLRQMPPPDGTTDEETEQCEAGLDPVLAGKDDTARDR